MKPRTGGWDVEVAISEIELAAGSFTLTPSPTPTTGEIGGFVWGDDDADRIKDNNEPLLPDVAITLSTDSGVLVTEQTTKADGSYAFTEIDPGIYRVTETDPQDHTSTTPNQVTVAVVAGASVPINFGDIPAIAPTATPTPEAYPVWWPVIVSNQ